MKKLLDKFKDEEILIRLFELYPNQKKSIKGYENALKDLRTIKPKRQRMQIKVYAVHDDLDPKNIEDYVGVSGHDIKDPDTGYAIEYNSWNEWLGMELTQKSLKEFTELDIIAHCLWEMTWGGYSNKEVQKNAKDLFDSCEKAMKDIKSGKAKTVPLKELKKKLKN